MISFATFIKGMALKIAIPRNMESSISTLLSRAGYPVQFREGFHHLTDWRTGYEYSGKRSGDIPVAVADAFDIGFCGSDWIEEREIEFNSQQFKELGSPRGIKSTSLRAARLFRGSKSGPRKESSFESLGEFQIGRKLYSPFLSLALVTKAASEVTKAGEIRPGSIIVSEYPELTRKFLEDRLPPGVKVDIRGENGAPVTPKEFRQWCEERHRLGIFITHGTIAESVNDGSGDFGVVINETGETLRSNNLKVVSTIRNVTTRLFVYRDKYESLTTSEGQLKKAEIDHFAQEINEAYVGIRRENELQRGSPER